jgi:hypothetical protein
MSFASPTCAPPPATPVQDPRPHHLAPIGEPVAPAPSIFLHQSPDRLAAKRKPAAALPARSPARPTSPLTPMRATAPVGAHTGGAGSPLRGKR